MRSVFLPLVEQQMGFAPSLPAKLPPVSPRSYYHPSCDSFAAKKRFSKAVMKRDGFCRSTSMHFLQQEHR